MEKTHCERCKYSWRKKKTDSQLVGPRRCPNCKTKYFAISRKNSTKKTDFVQLLKILEDHDNYLLLALIQQEKNRNRTITKETAFSSSKISKRVSKLIEASLIKKDGWRYQVDEVGLCINFLFYLDAEFKKAIQGTKGAKDYAKKVESFIVAAKDSDITMKELGKSFKIVFSEIDIHSCDEESNIKQIFETMISVLANTKFVKEKQETPHLKKMQKSLDKLMFKLKDVLDLSYSTKVSKQVNQILNEILAMEQRMHSYCEKNNLFQSQNHFWWVFLPVSHVAGEVVSNRKENYTPLLVRDTMNACYDQRISSDSAYELHREMLKIDRKLQKRRKVLS